ncbi:MAG: beta-lactamase family protein [Candidatus Sumerlaeia bacterium]|nr:beta-lactamase family protein [Candidatus Sumerlaeia bacterium]
MRFTLGMFAILTLLFIQGCCTIPRETPSPPKDPKFGELERLMDAYHREGMFNGIAMVARDGEVIFEKTYGYANEEWGAPVDRHTKFRLASVTKQFTAHMILQLEEEGKLSVEDTISDHLPWYREDTGTSITIHQLLTHTSGLPNYSAFSGFFSGPSRMTHRMRNFVEEFCSNDLEFEPGERYSYNNSGYYILGAILEEIEGKTWERVVEDRISKRGGMPDTGPYIHNRLMPRRAQGYWRDSDGKLQPVGYQDMTIWRAAGSMYSSANDLLRWDEILRNNILLGEEYQDRMFTRQQGTYGYGVGVNRVRNPEGETIRYVGHSGFYGGFNNYFAHFPDTGKAIILLNNGGRTQINTIRDGVINILLGNPYALPVETHKLESEGSDPRLVINRISSHGVISADDARFNPQNSSAGSMIYAMNFLVHDGERPYFANTAGGDAFIRDGSVSADSNSVRNQGMTYSNTDWLTSDLAVNVTGEDVPRLEIAWTFHNSSSEERPVRMLWFTDMDMTTAGSTSSEDRLAMLPKDTAPEERMILAFNDPGEDEPDSTSGMLLQVEGVPHYILGIAEQAGASGYWSNSGPFESIGPRAAGYKIPEELRNTVQHDEVGDGMTDGPRDVGVSIQADITLQPGESQTVRYLIDFGPHIEM